MSSNKYANLPDIDTAPDVYETEDVFPSHSKEESSDDEIGIHSRSHLRGRNGDGHARPEELDASSLNKDEASKKFRQAEKRRPRARIQYTYPPSPTSSASGRDSPAQHWHAIPKLSLSQRIANLKAELDAIEAELALKEGEEIQEGHPNAAEFIRELSDVKVRLSKAGSNRKDGGRGKLVNAVLQGGVDQPEKAKLSTTQADEVETDATTADKLDVVKMTADIDRRLGMLEKLIGSSTTSLDETSPLLPPLVVTVTRLHSMLTLLSQPRQLDNVSRRLKLIQPDLERISNSNHAQHGSLSGSQRRQGHNLNSSISSNAPASPITSSAQSAAITRTHVEQLSPILTRLAPILPNIPHILTRLRSLSALHTNAAAFQSTLEHLEEQQAKERADLADLEKALEGIEKSVQENDAVVKKNVESLEGRVEHIIQRLDELDVVDVEPETS